MSSSPPFKRSSGSLAVFETARPTMAGGALLTPMCCDRDARAAAVETEGSTTAQRSRLHQLEPHLHCSVIGTCLGTGELRRLMGRHADVKELSDLDVHHLAVAQAGQGGDIAKALHKALDQRHAGMLRRFAAASDDAALELAWREAWQQGEIPGAYWALLSHKAVTSELRQVAFGEVHMLSHLMGSANRQEIQRFVALERGHEELQERLDREILKCRQLVAERQALDAQFRLQALSHQQELAQLRAVVAQVPGSTEQELQRVALQTERRERAERDSQQAQEQAQRLSAQLEKLQQHAVALAEELAAAEGELQQLSATSLAQAHAVGGQGTPGEESGGSSGLAALAGQVLLYVGGRPSSMPAIRDFVQRHGGELLHHDGGLEARKGLLAAQLPRADLVVFPVDCVDHDSVLNLKRLCERHQRPFVALRSASLASFAAAMRQRRPVDDGAGSGDGVGAGPRFCLRHG